MKQVIIFILCFFIIACSEQKQQLPKLSSSAVILAFGDSLTYGTGASPKHDYPSILTALTSMTVINAGKPGEISNNGLKRLPDLLDRYQPELLILIHGGNDMLRKMPRAKTQKNLKEMIKAAKQRDISVILLGVPQPALFLLDSADIYANLVAEEQISADLVVLPEILSDSALKSDPIHPNDAGYQLLAESIFSLLQESGAIEQR